MIREDVQQAAIEELTKLAQGSTTLNIHCDSILSIATIIADASEFKDLCRKRDHSAQWTMNLALQAAESIDFVHAAIKTKVAIEPDGLHVHLDTPERDTGELITIDLRWDLPPFLASHEHAVDWIYTNVRDAWVHELNEALFVQGARRQDLHNEEGRTILPPDEDLYVRAMREDPQRYKTMRRQDLHNEEGQTILPPDEETRGLSVSRYSNMYLKDMALKGLYSHFTLENMNPPSPCLPPALMDAVTNDVDTIADKSVVASGVPSDPGMYLMWSSRSGWPAIEILQVEAVEGRVVFRKAHHRTDRFFELLDGGEYIGHSQISKEALVHFEARYQEARIAVLDMLSKPRSER